MSNRLITDKDIVDASRYIRYKPPFTNLGKNNKPTMMVRDANGLFVCTTFNALGFTHSELREHARIIAYALNKAANEGINI